MSGFFEVISDVKGSLHLYYEGDHIVGLLFLYHF
jgi:hypothetical protein